MVSKSKSKSKIIAVSVDNAILSFDDKEPETEAQEMDKVLDEIKTEPQSNDSIELQPIQEKKKPKARAKPKPKPIEQPVEDVKSIEQPTEEIKEVKPVAEKRKVS